MKSIKAKMIGSILVPVLAVFLIIAFSLFSYLNSYVTSNARTELQASAAKSAQSMDAALSQLEIRMQNLACGSAVR